MKDFQEQPSDQKNRNVRDFLGKQYPGVQISTIATTNKDSEKLLQPL